MNRIQHLVAKYKTVSFIILTIFLCGVYSIVLLQINAPMWLMFIINLVLAFIIYAYVEYSPDPIMRTALKALNDECNPYPLYEETAKLLTYKNSIVVQQIILMNHAVALRSMGEYQRNLALLKELNIDKAAGMPPVNKVVYYNNLMDAYGLLEQYTDAKIWYHKMLQIYGDIKNPKQLEQLQRAVTCANIFYAYCDKNYEKALELLNEMPFTDMKSSIDHAMLYAKTALAMGDTKTAKAKLEYIVRNGNKLYAVKEAQEMLCQM